MARVQGSISTTLGEPLVGVLAEENGRQVVRYFAGDTANDSAADGEQTLQTALAVIGAWRDFDWDELAAELDILRHESPPTPPIEL